MLLSYRIPLPYWLEDGSFARLAELLERHRRAVDEISLAVDSAAPGDKPLELLGERAAAAAERIEQLHTRGFARVGIVVQTTSGHHSALGECSPAFSFPPMVGRNGKPYSRPCRNSPQYRTYVCDKYRLAAGARPDFLWVDDDLYHTYPDADDACYCPACVSEFCSEFCASDSDRGALVARLGDPAAQDLRTAWAAFSAATLEGLCTDIGEALREMAPGLDVGLIAAGSSSGRIGTCYAALGGRRVACSGCGFGVDSQPSGQVRQALEVARQVRALPAAVDHIQYALTGSPCTELGKADQTILNECAMAFAAGCNGVLFAILPGQLQRLDAMERRLVSIEGARPHWEALLAAAAGTRPVGIWPVQQRQPVARWMDDRPPSWPHSDWASDVATVNSLAALGAPFAAEPDNPCAALLTGRAVEGLGDDELRRVLAGGVLLDAPSLRALWKRGLGELAGVRLRDEHRGYLWERFSEHPFNTPYAGDTRSVTAMEHSVLARSLEPLGPLAPGAPCGGSVADLSHLMRCDNTDCGPCATAYENPLGGRVVVNTYSPWEHLGTRGKWAQLQAGLRWATRDRLPLWMNRMLPVAALMRISDDATRFIAVLLNASYDPTGALEVFVRAQTAAITLYTGGIDIPLRLEPAPDGVTFTLPGIAPWSTVTLIAT